MKEIEVKQLSYESFKPFGEYASLINPTTYKIGEKPIEFFRDMVTIKIGKDNMPNIGVNRVEKREYIINVTECHNYTAEGLLPLDGDVIIHVGPATPNGIPDISQIKAFFVSKGTFVTLNPGVWHHAAYTYNKDFVNLLILLPERTYENDCHIVNLNKEDYIKINLI